MINAWFVRVRWVFFRQMRSSHELKEQITDNWLFSLMYDSLGLLPPNVALPGTAGCIPSAGGT